MSIIFIKNKSRLNSNHPRTLIYNAYACMCIYVKDKIASGKELRQEGRVKSEKVEKKL